MTRPPDAEATETEAARVLGICNACRYCEGYCPVFPAMARRLEFPRQDLHYLANLCHNCGACLHSCQYAAPHEFAVNVPRALARVRVRTYAEYAWPPAFGRLYARNGLTLSVALAGGLALFFLMAIMRQSSLVNPGAAGDFYRIVPHGLMVAVFAPVFLFSAFALGMGVARFWRSVAPGRADAEAAGEATRDALSLKHLGGGHGDGCNEQDDAFTLARRRCHHLTFYGFLLCFAATVAGTVQHYGFGLVAPYGFASVPKLFGVPGGLAMLVGTAGLWVLHHRRHPAHVTPEQAPMDRGFIALLFFTAASGLALAAFRHTVALSPLLAWHLGTVLALFATLPYSKFAHGAFRAAALLAAAVETRRAKTVKLAGES